MDLKKRLSNAVERREKLLHMRTMSNGRLLEERDVAVKWAYLGGCELTRGVGCRHLDVAEQVLTERGLV